MAESNKKSKSRGGGGSLTRRVGLCAPHLAQEGEDGSSAEEERYGPPHPPGAMVAADQPINSARVVEAREYSEGEAAFEDRWDVICKTLGGRTEKGRRWLRW